MEKKTIRNIECGDSIFITWIDEELSDSQGHVVRSTVEGKVIELSTGLPDFYYINKGKLDRLGSYIDIVYKEPDDEDEDSNSRITIYEGFDNEFYIDSDNCIISTNAECVPNAIRELIKENMTGLQHKIEEHKNAIDELEFLQAKYGKWLSEGV